MFPVAVTFAPQSSASTKVADSVESVPSRASVASRAALYVTLFAGLLVVHLQLVDYVFDDAYIHVRIADHLSRYGVPYFNPDEPVMASSSPLWTIVLAALFTLFGSDLRLVALCEAVATTGCVWVFSGCLAASAGNARPRLTHDAIAAGVMIPLLAAASIGLMETPLALLVAGIGMRLFQRAQPAALALFAVAAFVRVELAALFMVFAVFAIRDRRIQSAYAAAYAVAGAAPLVAYDLYFFGTLVPSAVHAKSLGYSLTMRQSVARALASWPVGSVALIGLIAGLLCGGWHLLRRAGADSTATATFVSGASILLTYLVSRAYVFEWYVPLYTVLLAWPLAAVACTIAFRPVGRVASVALVALVVIPVQLAFPRYVLGAAINPALAPAFAQGARVRSYIAVGRELFARLPDHTLVTSEIGGLGYGYQGHIDDAFGLISPAALRYHPMRVPEERRSGGIGAIPPGYVRETRPGLIVTYDYFAEALLRSDVVEHYVRIELPPFRLQDVALAEATGARLSLWGMQSLNVFVRCDLYSAQLADGLRRAYAGQPGLRNLSD